MSISEAKFCQFDATAKFIVICGLNADIIFVIAESCSNKPRTRHLDFSNKFMPGVDGVCSSLTLLGSCHSTENSKAFVITKRLRLGRKCEKQKAAGG